MEEEHPQKKEKGFFAKVWNKTIFPDMIKDAKEEKKMKKELEKAVNRLLPYEIKEL